MHHLLIRCVALGVLLTTASVAHAQAPAGGEDTQTQPWTFSFGVHEAFESNVALAGPNGGNDLQSRFEARLGYSRPLRRGQMDLFGDVSQMVYRQMTSLNQLQYSVGGGFSHAITPRLLLRVTESLTSGYAQDSRTLTDAGLIFPKVVTRVNLVAGNLTYALSPRTEMNLNVTSRKVVFESLFASGSDTTLRFNLGRQVTRAQRIGFSAGHTFTSGTTGDIQGFLGTYQVSFGERITLALAGGVRPYTLFGERGVRIAPGGSTGLTVRFNELSALTLTYERAVEQAYGFNRTHVADRLGAGYTVAVDRRLSVTMGATYGLNTYPLIPDLRLTGKTANLGAQYLLGRNIYAVGNYMYWVSEERPNPAVHSSRATVSLLYSTALR